MAKKRNGEQKKEDKLGERMDSWEGERKREREWIRGKGSEREREGVFEKMEKREKRE